jgi:hypothetical protein
MYLRVCPKVVRGANIGGFLLLHVECLCTKIYSTPDMYLSTKILYPIIFSNYQLR